MDTPTKPSTTKKALAGVALFASLGFGGLATANMATADGYGDSGSVEQAEEVDTSSDIQFAQLEDGDAEAEETEENEGRRGRSGKSGRSYSTAADTIGISVDELREAVQDGQTIAEVAEANGVSAEAVIDAIVESKTERLAEKVEEGRITQEEADEKLAEKAQRIEDKVFGVDSDNDNDNDDDDDNDDEADA